MIAKAIRLKRMAATCIPSQSLEDRRFGSSVNGRSMWGLSPTTSVCRSVSPHQRLPAITIGRSAASPQPINGHRSPRALISRSYWTRHVVLPPPRTLRCADAAARPHCADTMHTTPTAMSWTSPGAATRPNGSNGMPP
eukprot:6211181-Pleurochrysis_carterae.AAC.1